MCACLQAAQVIEKRLDTASDPRTSAFSLAAHGQWWCLITVVVGSLVDYSDSTNVAENSMAVVCGDFTQDGFPDVIMGSGAPPWLAAIA